MSEMSQPSTKPSSAGRGKIIAIVLVVIIIIVVAAVYLLTMKGTTTVVVNIPNGVGTIQTLNFSPTTITVVVGTNNTIKWINQDSIAHTVTSTSVPSGANSFDSGTLNPGSAYTLTLTVPGTYHYQCTVHPSWMIGTIVVKSG